MGCNNSGILRTIHEFERIKVEEIEGELYYKMERADQKLPEIVHSNFARLVARGGNPEENKAKMREGSTCTPLTAEGTTEEMQDISVVEENEKRVEEEECEVDDKHEKFQADSYNDPCLVSDGVFNEYLGVNNQLIIHTRQPHQSSPHRSKELSILSPTFAVYQNTQGISGGVPGGVLERTLSRDGGGSTEENRLFFKRNTSGPIDSESIVDRDNKPKWNKLKSSNSLKYSVQHEHKVSSSVLVMDRTNEKLVNNMEESEIVFLDNKSKCKGIKGRVNPTEDSKCEEGNLKMKVSIESLGVESFENTPKAPLQFEIISPITTPLIHMQAHPHTNYIQQNAHHNNPREQSLSSGTLVSIRDRIGEETQRRLNIKALAGNEDAQSDKESIIDLPKEESDILYISDAEADIRFYEDSDDTPLNSMQNNNLIEINRDRKPFEDF